MSQADWATIIVIHIYFGPYNIKDFAGLKNFTSVLTDPGMYAKKASSKRVYCKKNPSFTFQI